MIFCTFPFASITRIRFKGYDLSSLQNTPKAGLKVVRKYELRGTRYEKSRSIKERPYIRTS